MRTSDYMTRKMVIVNSSDTVQKTVNRMREEKIGSVLVEEDGKISGIFTERDLLNKIDFNEAIHFGEIVVGDLMTRDLKTVPHDQLQVDTIETMQKYNIRHMPVIENGEIQGIVSLRDLLARYRDQLEQMLEEREKELLNNLKKTRESEERFHTIFDNSAVAITFVDNKERIATWNAFAEDLLGMNVVDLQGKPVKDLYPSEEWERIREKNIRRLGMKHYMETKVVNKRGEAINVELSLSVIKDAEGEVIGSIGIMNDITSRKKLETLRKDFVGVVSHELRTPLIPIREGVSQVVDGLLGETTEEQKEFLNIVLSEIDRLKRIIDELLAIFKLEVGDIKLRKELVNLNALLISISSTFTPRVSKKNLELKLEFSKDDIELYADRDKLTQVFTNLLGNALKFTEEGYLKVSIVDNEKSLLCTIEDTGPGIAPEDINKLFQKFQQVGKRPQNEDKGTGLGLVISKDIVELHKGTIRVESELGKGTKFIFTLPKHTIQEVVRDLIQENIKEAEIQGDSFTVLSYEVIDFDELKQSLGEEELNSVFQDIEVIIRNNLRRTNDRVVCGIKKIFTLLPVTIKDNAHIVAERFKPEIDEYLKSKGLLGKINTAWKCANFPEDGRATDDLWRQL